MEPESFRHADQIRKRVRSHLVHHSSAMRLDSFHSHTESEHAAISRDFPPILYLDEDTTGSWSQITSTTRTDEMVGLHGLELSRERTQRLVGP